MLMRKLILVAFAAIIAVLAGVNYSTTQAELIEHKSTIDTIHIDYQYDSNYVDSICKLREATDSFLSFKHYE